MTAPSRRRAARARPCDAARAAAELVRVRRRARASTVAATKSSDVDVVTEADRSAERLIREPLLDARPDDAFLGEEGDDEPGTSGVRWIVDPIDGTVNFLYGIPQYAVSIAAEVDGEVVAGVVLNVATGAEYTATPAAAPAPRATACRSRVRAAVPLAERLVGTGFTYDAAPARGPGRGAARACCRGSATSAGSGSCALDLCAVAEGSLDGYVEEGVNLWDHAAGGLVAPGRRGPRRDRPRGRWPADGHRALRTAGFDEFRTAIAEAGYLAVRARDPLRAGNSRPSPDVHPAHRAAGVSVPGSMVHNLPCRRHVHVGLGDDRREERPKGVKRHGD